MYTGDKPSWISYFCAIIVLLSLVVIFHLDLDHWHESFDELVGEEILTTGAKDGMCKWQVGDPALFHLKTRLGVNYQGDHWFHIAENFMTQHSILRNSRGNTGSSTVYIDFDEPGFVEETNGMTKFMVALGVIQGADQSKTLPDSRVFHFIHDSGIPAKYHKNMGETRYIDHHDFHDHVEVHVQSKNQQTDSKFLVRQGQKSMRAHDKHKTVCVKNMGEIGGMWPTPQRGHWFPNDGDIASFRSKITSLCPPDERLLMEEKKTKKYKLVVYQRDISRKISNQADALKFIHNKMKPEEWEVKVLMHAKDRSPCELAHRLHNVDVMVTPHGFQSMLLLFLPRPALLFEVFPYRYYKRGYGPLSDEYGVRHHGVMSPALHWMHHLILPQWVTSGCMLSKQCRNFARNDDVLLTEHGINRLYEAVVELGTLKGEGKVSDQLY